MDIHDCPQNTLLAYRAPPDTLRTTTREGLQEQRIKDRYSTISHYRNLILLSPTFDWTILPPKLCSSVIPEHQ